MGAHPYWYIVKHEPDVNAALQALREREFRAGRYNPVQPFPAFPVDEHSLAPGAEHASIEEAQEDADADGTRSILDLASISEVPEPGTVSQLDDRILLDLFGTIRPTREQFEAAEGDFWEIEPFDERGQGVFITLYKDGKPDEIVFAGYSFD